MKESLAEELYAESLKLSKIELDSTSAQSGVMDSRDSERHTSLDDDESLWNGSDGELDNPSDLGREWQRRQDQFHTIGYRDGVIAGKEAAAQEGFNVGFKQSVSAGYQWGIVRGVTSALALLPDSLKEKLIETEEKRTEFEKLYESVHSVSTTDALRLFYDAIVAKRDTEQGENPEVSSSKGDLPKQKSDQNHLESSFGELQSLLLGSPAIRVELGEQNSIP
ncbi:Essential protein Yae1, N-terminal [Trema orientale]|uniref:Essential protein Yae1, N-terminal n=1 Tax=Trema orientale TaxID=63057 RepID=A0A2P5EXZ1_TREOI|nr:Essential protein Yae1, N-terminal [Trema orientale]